MIFNNAKYTFSYLFFPVRSPFINLLNTINQRLEVMCSFCSISTQREENTMLSYRYEEWACMQTSGITSHVSQLKGYCAPNCKTVWMKHQHLVSLFDFLGQLFTYSFPQFTSKVMSVVLTFMGTYLETYLGGQLALGKDKQMP